MNLGAHTKVISGLVVSRQEGLSDNEGIGSHVVAISQLNVIYSNQEAVAAICKSD